MPVNTATAPGKIILVGEHAVVYGRPAIAVPVEQVQARAAILAEPLSPSGRVKIDAPDINLHAYLDELPTDHPLRATLENIFSTLNVHQPPAFTILISSAIPVASGMGSSAALSIAIIRAVSAFLGKPLADKKVCNLAFQTEKLYHGNPSGVDNTVITYTRPVFFQRGKAIQTIKIRQAMTMVIADSGIPGSTAQMVAGVAARHKADPTALEQIFSDIGSLVLQARKALAKGQLELMGSLMNQNHILLQQIGVSCPELDQLVITAQSAGAMGAKLSGAGGGGNMIALTAAEKSASVAAALQAAGAARIIVTTLKKQA